MNDERWFFWDFDETLEQGNVMRVLVTAATKYGSTAEIADAIAATLGEAGHDTTVVRPEDVTDIDNQDAVVIGSAVYAGHWLEPAKQLIDTHAEALRARPVWLFSSGPVGDPPKPLEDPVDTVGLVETTGAAEHKLFTGKLDRSKLRFAEKAIVVALRAPEGDFRDFDEIRLWARNIAQQLHEANNAS